MLSNKLPGLGDDRLNPENRNLVETSPSKRPWIKYVAGVSECMCCSIHNGGRLRPARGAASTRCLRPSQPSSFLQFRLANSILPQSPLSLVFS